MLDSFYFSFDFLSFHPLQTYTSSIVPVFTFRYYLFPFCPTLYFLLSSWLQNDSDFIHKKNFLTILSPSSIQFYTIFMMSAILLLVPTIFSSPVCRIFIQKKIHRDVYIRIKESWRHTKSAAIKGEEIRGEWTEIESFSLFSSA